MQYLYKYTSHNTEHKYDIITKSQLWFSKVEDFNDPIDSRLDYRQEYTKNEIKKYWENFPQDKLVHSLEETLEIYGKNNSFTDQQKIVYVQQKAQIGILCFSVNPKNILMWSHYANGHKGIVYEFKPDLFSNSKTHSFHAFPFKVNYPCDRSYELLTYTLAGKEREKQFVKELTIKAKDWAYEGEYRMIDMQKNGNKNFNKSSLSSIIFGVKTTLDEIDVIKCLCKKYGLNHVNFKKAEFIKGKFEIEITNI